MYISEGWALLSGSLTQISMESIDA
jgi:hypothetical protein